MGTNFYAIIPVKERFITELKIFSDNITEKTPNEYIKNMLEVFLNKLYDCKIHLGKRSSGWAFLWDLNELKYYEPTLESIHKFIIKSKAYVQDEYGIRYSWEKFINDEIGYCLYPSEKPFTLDEIVKSDLNVSTKDYLIDNYFNKDIPYYRFCTIETYNKMHPKENNQSYFKCDRNFINVISNYSKYDIKNTDSEFISKENLRFALFSNFS